MAMSSSALIPTVSGERKSESSLELVADWACILMVGMPSGPVAGQGGIPVLLYGSRSNWCVGRRPRSCPR